MSGTPTSFWALGGWQIEPHDARVWVYLRSRLRVSRAGSAHASRFLARNSAHCAGHSPFTPPVSWLAQVSLPSVQLHPSATAKLRTRSVRLTFGGTGIERIPMLTWSPHSSHLMTLPSTVTDGLPPCPCFVQGRQILWTSGHPPPIICPTPNQFDQTPEAVARAPGWSWGQRRLSYLPPS